MTICGIGSGVGDYLDARTGINRSAKHSHSLID
jgi:hypothetical protein